MIENITSIKSYLNNVKMQTIWDLLKENANLTEAEKAQKQKAISKKIEDIKMKLKSGKRLSAEEMRLLKQYALDLHKKALAAEAERQSYKQAIKSCKTKDDVQKVFLQKIQQSIAMADIDKEMAEYITSAVQQEHIAFTKSDKYKQMKWKSDQRIEQGYYINQYKNWDIEGMDNLYEQVLKIAQKATKEFEIEASEGDYKQESKNRNEGAKYEYYNS